MARNRANIQITAMDRTRNAFRSVGRRLATVARQAKIAFAAMVAGAALAAREFMKFESATRPFARFMGSLENAQRHMRELQSIGRQGVVPTKQIIEASRELMQFSDGVLGSARDMQALADVSATTGNDIGNVARGVTDFIRAVGQGRDVDRASRQIQQLGIVSLEAREELRQIQDTGGDTQDMFAVLSREINKFAGGVQGDMDTGAAAVGRLRAATSEALINIGRSVTNTGAPALDHLADKIDWAMDSGAIEDFVNDFISAFEHLAKTLSPIIDKIGGGIKYLWRWAKASGFEGRIIAEEMGAGKSFREALAIGKEERLALWDEWKANDEERPGRWEARARQRRALRERQTRTGGFGEAGADDILSLLGGDDDSPGAGVRKADRGLSGMARNVMSRLQRMGHDVEEFGLPGMIDDKAKEKMQRDQQLDLITESVKVQKDIRDLLGDNLEAK